MYGSAGQARKKSGADKKSQLHDDDFKFKVQSDVRKVINCKPEGCVDVLRKIRKRLEWIIPYGRRFLMGGDLGHARLPCCLRNELE